MRDPYLDAGVRGYIVRTAKENLWRLRNTELRDLVQEGYLCFALVKHRYVGKVLEKPDGTHFRRLPYQPTKNARRHFMRLLQVTYANRITTLVRAQPKGEWLACEIRPENMSEQDLFDQLLPAEPEQLSMTSLIVNAPWEVRRLLAVMVDDVVRPMRRTRGRQKVRETTNQYYCRILGYRRGTDLSGMVQQYFER